ncbi:dynein regulatory complex protein 11-like isoform X2 [Styela clava]|uniref:dynein regulatory complex protein 11-like isoform X2 n=1 Tax=Styela clava TaxID=7725 RepID=UPI00193A33A1|nr:dynein regulatory complex protein 11-like isoform X2 [Styela clava]
MSHGTYNQLWAEAQTSIDDLLPREIPLEPPRPEKDRLTVFQTLATLYIKYIQILRKLEASYDQIVHPQKRRVLRQVVDGTVGRLLEVKNEMVNLEFSEFHYFDDILSDLKLTPNDIEIPVPKYYRYERKKILKDREQLLGSILSKMGPSLTDKEKDVKQMSLEEAIRLIQVHERARQGRLRAKFMKEIRMEEERERVAAQRGAPTLDPDVAATRIQKIWKGFVRRKLTRKQREEEMIFIGMVPTKESRPKKFLPQTLAENTEMARRVTQDEYEVEYQQALVTVKEKIREVEGPDMKERMQDQIRQWFIECRDATGKFPDYPDEEDGGSALLFKEKTPEEVEAEMAAKEEEKGGKKKGKKGKKSGKKKKGKKSGKKGKKGKKGGGDEEEEEPGWKMAPSNFLPEVEQAHRGFRDVWMTRDESGNFQQKHDNELIKEKKRLEVEDEVRKQVDELMREELNNLKMALDRDKGKKGKKGKKSGKKKKKKGKKSGKKGKKGKKEKDLTADRTIESLYEELVQQGILVRSPQIYLKDYIGDYSYLGTTLRQADIEPMPSLSDVRQLVALYGILPLGSQFVHQNMPQIKSILLAGPRGVGKKMLLHAICTETGANLFDLTPENIAGKYPGKSGLAMLIHMVTKVARELQPSVIFIGGCEKTFVKKAPKGDKTDPKRLKKDLPKILKGFKPEDRVVLVGTSVSPFDAELKPFVKTYERIILIPRPDYASRYILWKHLILEHNGIITQHLDVSSLTKITDGYTQGHVVEAVKYILTERRISQLSKKPLAAVEFVSPLARIDPIYKEEEEAFKNWYMKTPLGKKRLEAAKNPDEEEESGKGKKGKKKKK